jgi:hypothetical protein
MCGSNHSEAQVRPVGLKVQTDVKAGAAGPIKNHNHVQVRPTGLKVQTGVKAGAPCPPPEGKGKPNC